MAGQTRTALTGSGEVRAPGWDAGAHTRQAPAVTEPRVSALVPSPSPGGAGHPRDRCIQRGAEPRGGPWPGASSRAGPVGRLPQTGRTDRAPHGEAAHRQVSPAMKSRIAQMSSLFQKSLKYRSAIFISPHSSGL